MHWSDVTLDRDDPALMHEATRASWLSALLGLLSLVAGAILVAQPSHSLSALAVIFGIFLLCDGIVALVSSFGRRDGTGALQAVIGVLGVIAGILLIRHPEHAVNLVGLLIGLWLLGAGVVRLVLSIMGLRARLLGLIGATLEIIAGVVIVSEPHIGYGTLAIVSGIWLILNGIGLMVVGFVLHRAARAG